MAFISSSTHPTLPLSVRGNIVIDRHGTTGKQCLPHRVILPLNFGSVAFVDLSEREQVLHVTSPFARGFHINVWLKDQEVVKVESRGARDVTGEFNAVIRGDVVVIGGPFTSIHVPRCPEEVDRVLKETKEQLEKMTYQERKDAAFVPCCYCGDDNTESAQQQTHDLCKTEFEKHIPTCGICTVDKMATSLGAF